MHNAIRGFVGCFCRANRLTGWIIAVHALNRKNRLPDFWVTAVLAEFEAIVESVRRQMPLHLAGDSAGAAAGALGGVDEHGVAGHHAPPFRTFTITSWTMQPPDRGSTLEAAKSL